MEILVRRGLGFLPSVVLLATLTAAQAQLVEEAGCEDDTTTEDCPRILDQIVVTATSTETRDFDLPFTTATLDSWNISSRGMARTLPDALSEIPGIAIQKTAYGQASPYLRGFTGYHTVLLVDGVRVNNSVLRSGPNQYWTLVDPLNLSRLEVVMGPASVLYGSDAVGGTVNAISRAVGEGMDSTAIGGRLYYRGASAEDSTTLRLEGEGRHGAMAFRLGLTGRDFGDLMAGSGVSQPSSGYQTNAGDATYQVRFGSLGSITVAHRQYEVDGASRTHSTSAAVPWRGTESGSDRIRELDHRRELSYLRYRVESLPWADEFMFTLSRQTLEERRLRERSDGRRDRQGFAVNTLGMSTQYQKAIGRVLQTVGVDWYEDSIDSHRRNYDALGSLTKFAVQGPVADDGSYSQLGVFAQSKIPVGRLDLVVGVRHSLVSLSARRVEDPRTGATIALDDTWSATTGSLRALVPLGSRNRWRLFAGVSQGFRAPNLSDLTRFDSARSDEIETPVRELQPEEFLAWELGLKGRLPRGEGVLTLFRTDIRGLIIRTPTGRVVDELFEVTKTNSGRGWVQGVELRGRLALGDSFSVSGGATWVDGVVDVFPQSSSMQSSRMKVREPIDRLMAPGSHLALRWRPRGGKVMPDWVEASWEHSEGQNRLSSRDARDRQRIPPGGTPAYDLLSIRAGYHITGRLSLGAGLENLTDRDYRVHGSGINEAGRSLVVALDWRI